MSGKNTLWLYFQISTLYLDHHRALVDHGMSYILWKMFLLSWNFVFQVAQDWAFFVQVTLQFFVGWSWANFFAGYPSATEGSWGDFYRWHFTSILHWWGQHHWHHCHLFSPNWRFFLLDSFFLLDIFFIGQTEGDGGEANVVVSKSGRWNWIQLGFWNRKLLSGAMYGSIRPLSGNIIYAIEACKG